MRLGALARVALKRSVKLARDVLQRLWVLILRSVHVIDFPVPPNSLLRITSGNTIKRYYESGLACYLPIAICAAREGLDLRSGVRILDFGCGVGRELLHFTRHFPESDYFGCDVDPNCVRFIKGHYQGVKSYRNDFSPPLEYESGHFDMVYAVSVFSHLNPSDHTAWLGEFARIVKPGGLCFLTVEGPGALEHLALPFKTKIADLNSRLETEGALYEEYPDLTAERGLSALLPSVRKYAGVEGSYGSTALAPTWIRENWAGHGLEIVDILDRVIDDRQDLVILRRT